ncbi:uncharacterized protein LOC111713060 [Eurytemora carolleeae]|uniref:uncharacterized protein LOC111713060 n=1 Tax=Eurytemora carolleeae TaxID=1294199 RepID=UPI000C789143|nr:uncharacterized protein LOC111713060 [Eurytemora carolleeae]|eukprot:XP_023343619.1 uncharacterized protein LOC111713060 [Eurytemora affinis]
MKNVRELIAQGNRFDVVVNTGGLLAEDLCLSLLSSEGRVVSTLTATPGLPEHGLFTSILARLINSAVGLFQRNLIGEERVWIETRFRGEVLEYISDLVDQGLIDPVGERIFSMDQVELAFRSLAGGGHKGKLVIRMEQDSYSSLSKQLRLL